MSARFLLAIFDSAYVLALACWVGSTLFFAFGVDPLAWRVLGAEAGGRLARALLPRYYTWGVVSGAIALPAYLGVPLSFDEYRGPMVALQAGLILAGTLIMLYGANSLVPAMDAARAGGPEQAPRLERLRRRSVVLNAVALLLGVVLLLALVNRPAPRTTGIVEPTPLERARAQYERLRRNELSRPKAPAAGPDAPR